MGPNFHFKLYIFLYFGLMTDFNREILSNRLGNSSYFKFHAILNDPDNEFKRFYSTLFIYLISNTLAFWLLQKLVFPLFDLISLVEKKAEVDRVRKIISSSPISFPSPSYLCACTHTHTHTHTYTHTHTHRDLQLYMSYKDLAEYH